MKKLISTLPFFLFFSPFFLNAQYGVNNLALSGYDYVTVPDNPDGSLDIGGGFTVEAWVKLSNSANDQKIVSKADVTFQNAYIFGVQDEKVKFEVFDETGLQTIFFGGGVLSGVWVHLAGTYEVGGAMKVYINGELVGETPASSNNHSYTENPLRIGIASWDPIYFPVTGNIEEVRYFTAPLSAATIIDWMLRTVNSDHPNFNDLTLYHKYDEGTGTSAADASSGGNAGTLSNGSAWAASTTPFKDDYSFFDTDNTFGAVWPGKNTAFIDMQLITGSGLSGEQSILMADDTGDYSFLDDAPTGYDHSLSKAWRAAVQGGAVANLEFNLIPVDLTGIAEVVLLESEIFGFDNANAIPGNLNGQSFTVGGVALKNDHYYTLGFMKTPSSLDDKAIAKPQIEAFPNPSDGRFVLYWGQDLQEARVRIQDLQGRTLWEREVAGAQAEIDQSALPAGLYLVQLIAQGQTYAHRVQIR